MKRFDSYEDLIKYIGVDSPENIIGLKNILNSYLERHGSNLMKSKDEEPLRCFDIKIDNVLYRIGVTSNRHKESDYTFYYWLIDNDEERLRYKYKRNEIIDKLLRFLYLLDVILIILYVFILIC